MSSDIRIVQYFHRSKYEKSFWEDVIWALLEYGFVYDHPEWSTGYIYPESPNWIWNDDCCKETNNEALTQAIERTTEVGIGGGIQLIYDHEETIFGSTLILNQFFESDWIYISFSIQKNAVYREKNIYNKIFEVGRYLYTIIAPYVGYIHNTYSNIGNSPDELEGEVRTIYDVTYISPTVVDQLGQEKVVSAPVEVCQYFPDGGAELILCEKALHGCGSEKREAVEHHFGID